MNIGIEKDYYSAKRIILIAKHIGILALSLLVVVILQVYTLEVISSLIGGMLLVLNAYNLSVIITLLFFTKKTSDMKITYNTDTTIMRFPLLAYFGAVRLPLSKTTFIIIREEEYTYNDKVHECCVIEFRVFLVTVPIRLYINKEDGELFYNNYREKLKAHSVEVMYDFIER